MSKAVEALAATFPRGEAELIEIAREAREGFDRAMRADDEAQAEAMMQRHTAAVFRLNGDTMFASYGEDNAPGYRIARACAAQPGEAPGWLQAGEFVVSVNGLRALAEIPAGASGPFHVVFRALDLSRRFISATGYRSHFFGPRPGLSLQQAVEQELARMIDAELTALQGNVTPETRDWLDFDALPCMPEFIQDKTGQIAFAF